MFLPDVNLFETEPIRSSKIFLTVFYFLSEFFSFCNYYNFIIFNFPAENIVPGMTSKIPSALPISFAFVSDLHPQLLARFFLLRIRTMHNVCGNKFSLK